MSTKLTPWRPMVGMFEPFHKEMEEMMERFFPGGGPTSGLRHWAPRVDVEETDKELLVKADLPGVDPKNVEITVENGMLTIRGEKKEDRDVSKKNYHCVERFVGSFQRVLPLPPGVDADKVTATSTNGVVTVSVPKKPESQSRKFTVTPKG